MTKRIDTMERTRLYELTGFYENELTNNMLSFWLPRCEDKINGGYFTCFDNRGAQLVSHDKYTWSQGRLVWIFSKLASMDSGTFTEKQREQFLSLARSGRNFLMAHCLIGSNDWRCVFLMDETGRPKHVDGWKQLDMSIYADCFVTAGLAKYAEAANDGDAYAFAAKLYLSVLDRVRRGTFNTLPYPLSPEYRAHGIPMILSNTTKELYGAAVRFDPDSAGELKENLKGFTEDILAHFVDENNVLHEIITHDNKPVEGIFGTHVNPGHTIEDMWFMTDASDLLENPSYRPKIAAIVKKTLEIGWDYEMGGILHFCSHKGGEPAGDGGKAKDEPMFKQLMGGWGDKLWWPHSEALYTTLLCWQRTGDGCFLDWYKKVSDYTFSTFPNPDRELREWIQIRQRNGAPQDKVVALPVKDPYHIIRNYILIIELLNKILSPSTFPQT